MIAKSRTRQRRCEVPRHWWRPVPPGNPGGNPGTDEEGEARKPKRIGLWESTRTRVRYEVVAWEDRPSDDAIDLDVDDELVPVRDPKILPPVDAEPTST
jgi:hypothetical protein